MNDPKAVRDKLDSIKRLWSELERTAEESPEYENLIEKIQVLSAEYKTLIEAATKREQSTKCVPNGTDVDDQ